MIKLINSHTGTEMWVSEERLTEYLAAGHKLAAYPVDAEPVEEPKTAKKSKPKK